MNRNAWLYMTQFGGMPGSIHFQDTEKKKILLAEILQSYILKDIKSLIHEENIRAFNSLLYLLAQAQGNVVTVAKLANEVGLTARSIESYLSILEQTYVNFPLHSFSFNYGNELKKSKKYYLYDLGIRNALLKNFAPLDDRQDAGAIIEGFVFEELQKQITPETEIRFWRLKSGEEVDFIWIKNQRPYPIEVKSHWRIREVPQGLKAFLRRYPKTRKAYVISDQGPQISSFEDIPVHFWPFEKANQIPNDVA
jgi:predicted AAA+ superfamily ATPase